LKEEREMAKNEAFMVALKENKRWADVCTVISIVLVVCLDLATRIGMYIVLAAVIIVVCIWQAAAFFAASIQTLILERRDDPRHQR